MNVIANECSTFYGTIQGPATNRAAGGRRFGVLRSILSYGTLLALVFSAVACLAPGLDVSDARKPSDPFSAWAFTGLMLGAGVVWWSVCRDIRRSAETRSHLWAICGFAILFRAIVLVAPPILELDLYRYLWDGFVSSQGIDPYRYSPSEVSEAIRFGEFETDPDLRLLATAVEQNRDMTAILERVHYPDLTTVYPPVAQAIFQFSDAISAGMSLPRRICVFKAILIVFEFIMLAMTAILLRSCGRPSSWLIVPAWCPLAVLSVSNQGHLDSAPAMSTVAAVAVAARTSLFASACSGVLLGAAGAAKIYPLILTPLIATYLWRRAAAEHRTRVTVLFAASLVASSALFWAPLARRESRHEGFTAFAGHWEMYDSFFAILVENLKPTGPGILKPWYSFVPEPIRLAIPAPDLSARGVWLSIVGGVAFVLCRRLWRAPSLQRLLESAFLLLVWFWALGPACNPWYLLWTLPFLPFPGNPGWLALFVVAPILYLRFPMSAQFGQHGEYWFDHAVVFVLTAIWLVAVLFGRRNRQRLESNSTGTMTFSDPERNPSRSTLT